MEKPLVGVACAINAAVPGLCGRGGGERYTTEAKDTANQKGAQR